MWRDGCSTECCNSKCDECDGYVTYVQDGTLMCACSCHKVHVPTKCPECRGTGKVFVQRHAATAADKKKFTSTSKAEDD